MGMPIRFVGRPGVPVGLVLAGIGVLGALAILLFRADQLPFSICVLKTVTGVPCFTCGGTRAAARLVHLDLRGALAMNPLVTAGGLAVVPWAIGDLLHVRRGEALSVEVAPWLRNPLRALVVALTAANWIYLIAVGR